MPRFTIRIMLHDAEWSDYDILHQEMERTGFVRYIQDDNTGEKFELPWAEYNYAGVATRTQVCGLAEQAVAVVRRRGSILVTESAGRTWVGLDPA